MNRRSFIVCPLLILTISIAFAVAPQPPVDWKQVDQDIAKGLPKSAIEKLDQLIEQAKSKKNYAEAVKAIGMKVSLEGTIQGNRAEEKVRRIKEELEQAPPEMKPMLNSILANWYWHYFQQNRWRFMQRTQSDTTSSKDFTTWDLSRIIQEIDKEFTATLAYGPQLKDIAIADYDDLLIKGTSPDAYRPTLYDFVAHNALAFYSAGEQAGSKVQDAFDVSADGPIFGSVDEFLAWEPATNDQESPKLKAIRLYQDLLRFHADDDDPSARLDANLLRLSYGNNIAFGEAKGARYKAALLRFQRANPDHPITARAMYARAQVIHAEGDLVEANRIAKECVAKFKDTVGANLCHNLSIQIERPSIRVTTERVWNDPTPNIDVNYRNLTKIHFRLVNFDFDSFLKTTRYTPESLDPTAQRALLDEKPLRAWNEDLPPTKDYQERLQSFPIPDDLEPGSYFLISSCNEAFDDKQNQVSITSIWVSDLAIVVRTNRGDGFIEGFVLDAKSGDPIAGASVKSWMRDRSRNRNAGPSATTDKNGLFVIRDISQRGAILIATHNDQRLATNQGIRSPAWDGNTHTYETTKFFTDRSLYRPGQTIQYKGICMRVEQVRDRYDTIGGRDLTVVFADRNGKEIERVKHRTNDYGSFSGSVTAPRDRVLGSMRLYVDGGPNGNTLVNVEEYKRPKFRVTIDDPTEAVKLRGDVTLTGKATAYTGAAIGGAKVQWRVVRKVTYPRWWIWRCWWMPPAAPSSQEISHGVSETSPSGKFDVTFKATPDESVLEESEPTFSYTLYADVTDTTGETRSNSMAVRVGYTAISASLSANEWLTTDEPIGVNIRTASLNGKGMPAECDVKIYALVQPEKVARSPLAGRYYYSRRPNAAPGPDPANPDSWEDGDEVYSNTVTTDESGSGAFTPELPAGIYRVRLKTTDEFGKTVTAVLPMRVLDPSADKLNIKVPQILAAKTNTVEPGESYSSVWGSGYDRARVYVEIVHRQRTLQSYWTEPGVTQHMIRQKISEKMRGGFTVRTTMVRENRAYMQSRNVSVPWTNKRFTIKWEHFVSKLKPAAEDTWTAIITGSGKDDQQLVRAAEMVATLYDASLDAFRPHAWMSGFGVFRRDYSRLQSRFENNQKQLNRILGNWHRPYRNTQLTYRHFPPKITQFLNGFAFGDRRGRLDAFAAPSAAAPMMDMMKSDAMPMQSMGVSEGASLAKDKKSKGRSENTLDGGDSESTPDLDNVSARKNLNETAFFFPQLIASEDGTVKIQFTMPEALTEWKFMGFAHDTSLRAGLLTGTTVTAKDLMVQPNPPRFVREGDEIEFTVKVSNQSPTRQEGTVRLTFADARTNKSADAAIGNSSRDQKFEIAAGESQTLSWKIAIPDDTEFITYKAVGSTGRLSDGEEGFLPVLSRRILVTESLPLPIRGKQTKDFNFDKLAASGASDSLKHKSLTVQMVSNPSWYAVMALPYLMEFPHECTEQTFNRLYANALARHIAGSDPKIHRIFEQWRGTPALDSPLEKNQDLKAVMIEETPWYRQAQDESQARRNVGILFEDNRLNEETARTSRKLAEMQLGDGRWPWFPGGRANDYITLYITCGYGRMRHLGVDVDIAPALKAVKSLDAWMKRIHDDIPATHRDKNHLSTTVALYLYARSFFAEDVAVAAQHRPAFNYWVGQAKRYWLDLGHRQSQAHMAIALKRFDNIESAREIMRSLKERSVSNEEMGMFWRELEVSWWWYRAPIETQAMMIEAFDEVMNDKQAVEDCKVWLLKQKQTQDWKTTKATADAVYALLLRGSDLLASDALVEVSLGGEKIKPENVEAGTGFYEQRFHGGEIQPELGAIEVKKVDEGVAWGSVHWQYLEDMSKVTPYEGTPLKLTKELYLKKNTNRGPELQALTGPAEVGDELVVRVVLRTDRDMEYVHLKDYRGSGTEPVNVLSRYKYQDGLGYYEMTRDTASHFYIDYLPKGTYVFEYSTRVQLRGKYQTGVASIECMYAPEFNSHSESLPIEVR